jgi:hypothetical protein
MIPENKQEKNTDNLTITNNNGTVSYYKNGQLHRDDDLPAVEEADGTTKYYKDGKLHRDGDNPAVIKPNGDTEYYQNGLRHRTDGPAIQLSSGQQFYYFENIEVPSMEGLKLRAEMKVVVEKVKQKLHHEQMEKVLIESNKQFIANMISKVRNSSQSNYPDIPKFKN